MKLFNKKDKYYKMKIGIIPSSISEKDIGLRDIISIPDKFQSEYKSEYPNLVFNQHDGQMCMACSISLIRHIQLYRRYGLDILPDILYIYSKRDNDMYQGNEMIPKEALTSIVKYGIPEIISDKEKYLSTFSKYDYNNAKKLYKDKEVEILDRDKVIGYYKLSTPEEIKTAILNFGAVTAVFRDNESLYYPKVVADIRAYIDYSKYTNNTTCKGHHQMTIIGWRNNNWIVQNSWGEFYGLNGVVYIPFEYPIIEAWAIIDKDDDNQFGIFF